MARFAKVKEIAERFRVSADAVYLWIRHGKIPADCIVRIAGTVRVDEEQFERQLKSGGLFHPRGRQDANSSSSERKSTAAADNFTTIGSGPRSEHRWATDAGRVDLAHPFSPDIVGANQMTKTVPNNNLAAGLPGLSGRITVPEIAHRLCIGRLAVYALLVQGTIPGIRLGRRWIITRHAYETWERTCGMRSDNGFVAQPEVNVVN